ncbi:MAG: type II 3-dehydroquinate dehydratase [Longimicrobiales bacterium]
MAAKPEALRISVVHGPNLNLLGAREPELYGATTLAEIDTRLRTLAAELDVTVDSFQSNVEGALVDRIQQEGERVAGFLVNAGAYTHTSVALRDALLGVGRPFVEIHVSNLYAREPYRQRSLLADVAAGVVIGFGADGYLLGLRGLVARLER